MSAVRILTCQQCGKEWSRPAQRGQLPKRCPECKQVKGAVRLEARAVPTMEGGVAVVSGPYTACPVCEGHDCSCAGGQS